ncbi:hypothetical protein Cgig2_018526 [Carnegiea gigantea]|uniref:Uncharacterized protein n=1 Tax=Carnegiea gigantea TaxID=171969 RepID=A0A9Q1GVP5_9CARY|nr:hypothetical protein Cgig2_018526 [Carnegiea gigantea]
MTEEGITVSSGLVGYVRVGLDVLKPKQIGKEWPGSAIVSKKEESPALASTRSRRRQQIGRVDDSKIEPDERLDQATQQQTKHRTNSTTEESPALEFSASATKSPGCFSERERRAVADLQSAYVEFQNLQPKEKASNDSGAPSFNPTLSLHKPDSEVQILGIVLIVGASITVEKEDHRKDVLDSQSLVPQTTSARNPSTAMVNENHGSDDDKDNAPLIFPLRNTSQVNCELSIKKPTENQSKESDEPSFKKGKVRKHTIKIKKSTLQQTSGSKVPSPHNAVMRKKRSPRAYGQQQEPDFGKLKLTKEVVPEKDHEKRPENLPLAYYSPYVIRLIKLDRKLSQDEMVISEYVFDNIEDMDDGLTLSLHKLDSEDQILVIALIGDASITIEEEDHREDVLDSQSPVPHTTSAPNLSTAVVNEDHGSEDDEGSAPLRFLLRNTSQVNKELSIKKPAQNKSNDEPSSKKGKVRKHTIKIKNSTLQQTSGSKKKGHPRAYGEQEEPDSSKLKLTKEVLPKKNHKKRKSEEVGPSNALRKPEPENLPLPYCSLYVIRLIKLDRKLSQDEMVIYDEPLFNGCGDKEAIRVSMATLGEEVGMNVINMWCSILNDQERKRDLATPSRLFISCDQSVSASQSTYCSIITALVIITKTLS